MSSQSPLIADQAGLGDLEVIFGDSMEQECLFCDSVHPIAPSAEFVLMDTTVVAASHVVSDGENYLGYVVLHSKAHARGFAELNDSEASEVGVAMSRLSRAMKQATGAENIYAVFFAEVVPHLHVLMTCRYPDTPREFWRMNILDWPAAPRGDRSAVAALCDSVRELLAEGSD